MKIGDQMDVEFFKKGHRPWEDMQEFVNALRKNMISWCWGAEKFTKMNDFCLRFSVNGHLLKGLVYLVVNASDTFDVYYTSKQGKIVDISTDVYLDQIVEVIDNKVETDRNAA